MPIDRYEDFDKFHSPNYAFSTGRNSAKLGIGVRQCPYRKDSNDNLHLFLRSAWLEGYIAGIEEKLMVEQMRIK